MTTSDRKETPTIDKPDVNQVLIEQRKKFRTQIPANRCYIWDEYTEGLFDEYHHLLSDIRKMKAHDPIPQEILTESLKELGEITKKIEEAGGFFGPCSDNPFLGPDGQFL